MYHPQFKTLLQQLDNESAVYRERINGFDRHGGDELIAMLDERIPAYNKWRFDLMHPMGEIGRSMDAGQRARHRELVLASAAHVAFQDSPFCWRIVQRPEGYVGDAKMMNFIYCSRYEGDSPWGMLVHKVATNYRACQAVRNRKSFLRTCIEQLGQGNVLSLAAGPAREIVEYLDRNPDNDRLRFLALDHDVNALHQVATDDSRLIYGIANALHMMLGRDSYTIPRTRHTAISERAEPRESSSHRRRLHKDHYELVYSAGLYDYLVDDVGDSRRNPRALTAFLFSLVKPGGKLIIGNFNHSLPDDNYFSMEFLTNWLLHYRDDEELLSLTNGIPAREIEDLKVEKEETGINSFLVVGKH